MSQYSISIDVEHEFEWELSQIQDGFYRDLAVRSLNKAPAYFWFVPASSSGKYHPKSSLGMGGLVRHVKAVFRVSEELLSHSLYSPFSDEEKDQIRVAILLHDACKQGTSNTGSHTLPEHPLLVRDALFPYDRSQGVSGFSTEEMDRVLLVWNDICNLIETHMGIWNTDREGNEILNIPKTKAQLHVHQCDYLASRKIIEVDTTPRKAQSGYKKETKKDWRNDVATEGQVNYIKKLVVMCTEKQVIHPYGDVVLVNQGHIAITKGQANELIEGMKALLGIN